MKITVNRIVNAPKSQAWEVISDPSELAEADAYLDRIEVIEGAAKGMRWRVWDRKGRSWTETCVRWDEGVGYTMAIDVAESSMYRRLFRRFDGSWMLEEQPDGTCIMMSFDADLRYGPIGSLLGWLASRLGPRLFAGALDNLANVIEQRSGEPNQMDTATD